MRGIGVNSTTGDPNRPRGPSIYGRGAITTTCSSLTVPPPGSAALTVHGRIRGMQAAAPELLFPRLVSWCQSQEKEDLIPAVTNALIYSFVSREIWR
jgi:hypothetical protein